MSKLLLSVAQSADMFVPLAALLAAASSKALCMTKASCMALMSSETLAAALPPALAKALGHPSLRADS